MSFERYLGDKKNTIYENKYIEYEKFKGKIKSNFTDEDEQVFSKEFEQNFDSCFNFAKAQFRKLKNLEHEEISSEILGRGHLLSEFVKLNIISVKRILKRHDKKTGFLIFKKFKDKLKKQIFLLKRIDKFVSKSLRHDSGLERYLISTDCEVFVQMTINNKIHNKKNYQAPWNFSLYLDNNVFELYFGRLHKDSDAEQIRIFWSGSSIPEFVTIERKSSKTTKNFLISSLDLLDFLNGKNVYKKVAAINKNDIFETYNKIQSIIKEKKLRPMIKVFNNNTIFKTKDLVITWKTGLIAIKECSDHELIENEFPLTRWCRPDASLENFDKLHQDEILNINQSVLEIKGKKPEWLEDLLNRNARRVDDFSEYLHGAYMLNPGIGEIPYWIRMINRETVIEMAENNSRVLTPIDSKPIVIPVRVEPKVFFANERTFLSWIQFAIFLGGIGTAMLGLGDSTASICGIILIIVSSIFSIYSLCLFHWRARKIREKHPGPYDDKYGPFVLVGVFLFAIVLCSIFKFPLKK